MLYLSLYINIHHSLYLSLCITLPAYLLACLSVGLLLQFIVVHFCIGSLPLPLCVQVDLLAHMWRYPTVSIHGIEGAFSAPGTKTVIPAKVAAKFSIRQVPSMDPEVVKKQVSNGQLARVLVLVLVSLALTPTGIPARHSWLS